MFDCYVNIVMFRPRRWFGSLVFVLILICLLSSSLLWILSNNKTFYVLLWSHSDFSPFYFLTVKDVFVKNNCSFTNCFVTANRNYFGGDLSQFHAIAFNGRKLGRYIPYIRRWPHHKFIYYNTESTAYTPIRSEYFNGFFNWTATYRLDSDISYPYILIKDRFGNDVGPKTDMKWEGNTEVDEDIFVKTLRKSKAAVAFISRCQTRSDRIAVIKKLDKELRSRGYSVDVVGKCGNRKCSKNLTSCDDLVEKYYFYLAFENSLSEDFVTEKLLRAVNHGAVPVVFGGANYSRFLPPGSYLNARSHSPQVLAIIMVNLIRNPERYAQFFGWTKYYTYHDPMATENVCALCTALNNKKMYETISEYPNFRDWWNGKKSRRRKDTEGLSKESWSSFELN